MNDLIMNAEQTDGSELALAKGYKRTEVGVIPEDWEVLTGNQLFIKIQDGTHFSPKISGGDFLYLTSKNIRFGYLKLDSVEYIDCDQHEKIYRRCNVQENDILLTKDGANTGNAALNILTEPFSLLSSVAFLRLDFNKYCAEFFLQQILSGKFQFNIQQEMSGNAITRLTLGKINNLKFYVPNKQEQTAIANALSDVDALLSEIEKLISKKQVIKTATMQQLLTGQTRLPEFAANTDGSKKGYQVSELGDIPEDWEVVNLSDIAKVKGGKRLPKGSKLVKEITQHPYIRVVDMSKGTVDMSDLYYVPDDIAQNIKNYKIYENEIFISVAGTLGVIGRVPQDLDGANLTENANRICELEADSKYIFYWLNSKRIQDEILAQSTVGAQPKLALGKIQSFKLLIPNSMKEQAAIAAVLSDMDAEIQALEQQLEKTQQIKQGMMQQLLTGKIRLLPVETHA